MKILTLFAYVFAIFTFLTIGSLLLLVSSHILSLEDAIAQLRTLYTDPLHCLQALILGFVCIGVGLGFTRMLLKKRRQAEVLIFQSEIGPIVISTAALEDAARKVLKRFSLVKDSKIKCVIQGKDIEVKLRLTLWSGGRIQDLLLEIQDETKSRLRKMLGPDNRLEITCDVTRIEDHDVIAPDFEDLTPIQKQI